jgi:hypothetical protein
MERSSASVGSGLLSVPFRLWPRGRGGTIQKWVPIFTPVAAKSALLLHTTERSFSFSGVDHLDWSIPQHPRVAHITVPRSQSRLPQPLDLLHRAGSVASDAEWQTEMETAVSRNRDQDMTKSPRRSSVAPLLVP